MLPLAGQACLQAYQWPDTLHHVRRYTYFLWTGRATVSDMVGELGWAALSSSPILPQQTGGTAATTFSLMLSERRLDLSRQESRTQSGLCFNSLLHYDYFGLPEVDSDDELTAQKI